MKNTHTDKASKEERIRPLKVLALDIGEATIGLAISDELGITAQGLPTLQRKGVKEDIDALHRIVTESGVDELLLGLPRNMNGSIGIQGEKVLTFGKCLEQSLGRPVRFWDERLTTVAAERTLIQAGMRRSRRRKAIDRVAAILILQGYLDSQRSDHGE